MHESSKYVDNQWTPEYKRIYYTTNYRIGQVALSKIALPVTETEYKPLQAYKLEDYSHLGTGVNEQYKGLLHKETSRVQS
jgi:hypothetical protein